MESRDQTLSIGMLFDRSDLYDELTTDSCQIKDLASIDRTSMSLVTIDICGQTDNYILQDGFKSFPSGHSSGMLDSILAGAPS